MKLLNLLFAPPRSRCFALLLALVAALCVQRGEAQASSQGGMFYGAAGGVFGPSYQVPFARVGPFGGVSVSGANAVSFGGNSQRGYGGYGARGGGGYGARGYGGQRYGARGGVYGGSGAYRGAAGVVYGRKMLQEQGKEEVAAATAAPATPADTGCKTMLEIIQSRDDLSMLRELLDEIPAVKATLDAVNLSTGGEGAPGSPTTGSPLRLENGSYFTDTLFAPNDEAILRLLQHMYPNAGVDNSTAGDDADAEEPASLKEEAAAVEQSSARRERALRELLGKGNATVAANFIAYHVVPDRRIALPELQVGELLNTALGGQWRLMADRMEKGEMISEDAADDGYDDGDGKLAVIRGMGSQAGVLGGRSEACNGVVFVVDHVLLPVDLDGQMDERQANHAEKIKEAMEKEEEERGDDRRRR